jgi:hypothetical protein
MWGTLVLPSGQVRGQPVAGLLLSPPPPPKQSPGATTPVGASQATPRRNSRCCPPTRSPRRKRVPRRAGSGAGGSPGDGGSRRAPRIEPRVRYRANEPRASVWWPRPPTHRGGLQHGVAGTRRRISNRRRPLRRRPTRSRELDSRPELRTRLLGLASPRQEATTAVGGGGCRCRHGPEVEVGASRGRLGRVVGGRSHRTASSQSSQSPGFTAAGASPCRIWSRSRRLGEGGRRGSARTAANDEDGLCLGADPTNGGPPARSTPSSSPSDARRRWRPLSRATLLLEAAVPARRRSALGPLEPRRAADRRPHHHRPTLGPPGSIWI